MEMLTWRTCLETALKYNGETYEDILHASPPLVDSERWDREFVASPLEDAMKSIPPIVTVYTPDHIYCSAVCPLDPNSGYALAQIERDPAQYKAKQEEAKAGFEQAKAELGRTDNQ